MAHKSQKVSRRAARTICAMVPFIAFAAFAQPADAPTSAAGQANEGLSVAASPVTRESNASEDSSAELPPIEVLGRSTQESYNISRTNTATGTDTLTIDTPQSIQVIPEKLLQDQAAESLQDAVRNAPGVYVQQGEGNRDEFYIRGVKTKSDFFLDGLRDDTEYFRPLYNVAHVDVLQGPAALLFGRGGAGVLSI